MDRIGIASLQGTIPKWRLVGSLTWEKNSFGFSTTVTFTPEYQDATPPGMPAQDLSSRTLLDMQAWLQLNRLMKLGFFDGLKLTAGALNVLNKDVDFAHAGAFLGYDVTQADLKQRFTYVRITKAF
jgi:outer membrane receptor protein involved in Fe transport